MNPDATLSALVVERGLVKAALTRFKTFCETADRTTTIASFAKRLDANIGLLARFDKIQTQIEIMVADTDAAASHMAERDTFETTYFDLISAGEEHLGRNRPASISSAATQQGSPPVHSDTTRLGLRLPEIKIPIFDGSYSDWIRFRDTYQSLIHDNDALSDVQKFHYLNSSLKGQAARIIQSLGLSAANYVPAWESLKNRYEDSRALVLHHTNALLDVQGTSRESPDSIRQFIDDATNHMYALRTLGENTNAWSTIVLVILARKLDAKTRGAWEKRLLASRQTPTFNDLRVFLEEQCKYLERTVIEKPTVPIDKQVARGQRGNRRTSVTTHVASAVNCPFCQGNHAPQACEQFRIDSRDGKIEKIKRAGACFNCLQLGHSSRECTANACRKCGRKHNTLIHTEPRQPSTSNESPAAPATPTTSATPPVQSFLAESTPDNVEHVVLSTAMVYVKGENGNKYECRVLLDSGSQAHFVTENLCTRLGLQRTTADTTVGCLGDTTQVARNRAQVHILSRTTGYQASLSCLVLDNITSTMPNSPLKRTAIKPPTGVVLADPCVFKPGEIDMLIGAGAFWELLCVGQIKSKVGSLIWQKTQLGWILGGTFHSFTPHPTPSCHMITNQELHNQIARFWEIEDCATSSDMQADERHPCETHFVETTTRDHTGRFIVNIPFTERIHQLGQSREQAEKRLLSLERKFRRLPELAEQYKDFMSEYERQGHMSLLPEGTDNRDLPHFYLPHHAVFKAESTTTKMRVVFDGSAETTTGLALNETQEVGPTVQDDLFTIVLRFRLYKYVLSADVAKMYRQILITPEQRKFQRILWRPSQDRPIQTYELNTVTYGTASAPFLATRVLRQIGLDAAKDSPAASRAIVHDFYVDDLLTGADSITNAINLREQLTKLLASAGLELRKWASNSAQVFSSTAVTEPIPITVDKDPKTLGLHWIANQDKLRYSLHPITSTRVTKRVVLSEISKIFDPLGLIGPITIRAKMLMQEIWQQQLDWDESLPQTLHTKWTTFKEELNELHDISILRRTTVDETQALQLHGFCDASEKAYGACIYLRSNDRTGHTTVHLLCAKSRVAPLKKISLPRLELCGAVLLSGLMQKVKSAVELHVPETYYWCDSTIVLAWLAASPGRWKTYVANRVSEIQRLTDADTWSHVVSGENPADCISRGTTPANLKKHTLWWHGPSFLTRPRDQWPAKLTKAPDTEAEKKGTPIVLQTAITDPLNICERYSSFTRLLRVVAYCMRFLRLIRSRPKTSHSTENPEWLSTKELEDARIRVCRLAQQEEFKDELRLLHRSEEVPGNSRLVSLRPFIDESGLLRVGGRLSNARIPYEQQHPIILPAKHPLTLLIVTHEHQRLLHAGCQLTVASLRTRYWPLSCKGTVKKVIHRCITCFRAKPPETQQLMGDLPAPRLTPTRPFSTCGVDYAGPYRIRDRTRTKTITKAYACIFVCFSTKAVHIELATDLTTDAFLNCFRRFIARRGHCVHIYSDNGTNFTGAKTELGRLSADGEHNATIANFLANQQTQWHLIPPRAPHFGGLWESAVRSMKFHVGRVIGDQILTFEELYTLLVQVESCLNSRPLSPISDDPNDFTPLTPGHFLIGESTTALPHPDLAHLKTNRLNRYQLLQSMLQSYWRRWHTEYLHNLQQRGKWRTQTDNHLAVGTLVIVKEDNLPPLQWRLGRILELHPGRDAVTRVVTINTAQGVIKRSIQKIRVLPTSDNEEAPRTVDQPNPN